MSLIESLSAVHKKISHAAMRAGRDPSHIKLVVVSKTVPPLLIQEAADAGIRIIGENRVQEAEKKMEALRGRLPKTVSWHMIGHLQRNKAMLAVRLFDMIQSVDSIDLAKRIDRYAGQQNKVQQILIQVKLDREERKSGIEQRDLIPMLEEMQAFGNIHVVGLMTIPPFFENPEDVRPYFRQMREIRERAEGSGVHLSELSMGMSGDFEVAVEEGATMVRIGSAIFGRRVHT
jgi:pyridoxal phosphate enzyme (YggS family)